MKYEYFKRKVYSKDELKLHIKRNEKKIIKLENQYKSALLKEKELLSKPHIIMDISKCRDKYGNYRLIMADIDYLKRQNQKLNNIINERSL
jgi:hypothetical protein